MYALLHIMQLCLKIDILRNEILTIVMILNADGLCDRNFHYVHETEKLG